EEIDHVEVLEAHWRPWGDARVAPAQRPVHTMEAAVWTDPDDAPYASASWLPEQTASVGAQGWMRGAHVAQVLVRPVRWNPSTHALEALDEVRVRLVMKASSSQGLPRERVVSDWETGLALPKGPTKAAALGLSASGPIRSEPFKATQVPSVLGSPVAYLIITNDALAGEFQRLADWKTEAGIPAVVRTTSFIDQQYPFGSDQAERVRMFIKDAYTRWGTKWDLLAGDVGILPPPTPHT